MNKNFEMLGTALELRLRAETKAKGSAAVPTVQGASLSPESTLQVLHELRVHQIELEMQNEDLLRVQGELDQSRARYFDLYDLAPVGYCTVSPEGRITESNLTAATLLGLLRTDLVNKPFTRFILPEDQDIYYLHRRNCLSSQEPQTCELRVLRKDGTECWVSLTSTETKLPGRNPDQKSAGATLTRVVLANITARKVAEAEQARLEAILVQAKKLETLGVLAGGVAHDFNNLVTAIVSNAAMGADLVGPNSKAKPFLKAIEAAALKAGDLTTQLLAYAGKGKRVIKEVDLDIVVQELAQVLTVSLPSNLTLRCKLADRVPFVKGDPTQLFQVLMNLVMNAFEAFSVNVPGEISLRTRTEGIDAAALASGTWALAMAPGRYVTIEVVDTGAGMTSEVLARAFEPFYTTKATGRGLGLAAVLGILGTHGGGLRVRSVPGQGSSFKVYLPVMTESRSVVEGEACPSWRGKGVLLVVEPGPEARSKARRLAEHLGFKVLEASKGPEAVEMFGLHHRDLALVLLDQDLPEGGSRTTLDAFRKINDKVPIVLCGDHTHHPAGAATEPILRKPYRTAEFQLALQRALEGEPAQVVS